MFARTTIAGIGALLGVAVLAAGCSDPTGTTNSDRRMLGTPSFAVAGATPMRLDQFNGHANAQGATAIIKGFNPVNPQNGDAIIATFFWTGSAPIPSVAAHKESGHDGVA